VDISSTVDLAKTPSTISPAATTQNGGMLPSTTLDAVRRALDDMQGEEIIEIDLRGKTALADTMVIVSGRSNRHVGSIADRVAQFMKEDQLAAPRVEGLPHCDWVLIDAGDVIVHVFRPEVRQFYNLEKMWSADRPDEMRVS
jgi:ribosome-associated protein